MVAGDGQNSNLLIQIIIGDKQAEYAHRCRNIA